MTTNVQHHFRKAAAKAAIAAFNAVSDAYDEIIKERLFTETELVDFLIPLYAIIEAADSAINADPRDAG